MDYRLNQEEIELLQSFIDGKNNSVLSTDLPERLFRLAEAVRRRSLEEARKAVTREETVRKRLDKVLEKKEKEYLEGNFDEANRNSLEVAYAIKYYANKNNIFLRKGMLICILFDVYANWLYSAKQKLTDEEPKATQHGPQFWKVSEKINMALPVANTVRYYEELARFNPGVVAVIKRTVDKYASMDAERVEEIMKNNIAYKNAHRDNNNGKWNKVLLDKDIYLWKKETH